MNEKEAIEKLFDWWKESYDINEDIDDYFDLKQQKQIFLSNVIIGLTTYDYDLDLKFGKIILETLNAIQNRKTFEYIRDESNYEKYIISCNFIKDWLDWGSSIRGAWFDFYGAKLVPDECLSNVGYDKEYIRLNEGFMTWLIEFLQS